MITGISYGIQYTFGVFFKPLAEEFGWTRAMLSGVFSVFTIVYGVFGIVMGELTDRYGPRIVLTVGGLIMGLSLIMTSQVKDLWQFYIYYGILFAIGRGVGYVPLQSTTSRWFTAKKGFAMGIVAAGSGFGTLILSPVAAFLISAYSWRASYIIFGIITLAVVIGSAMLIRRSPEDIGLLPYGIASGGEKENSGRIVTQEIEEGSTLRQAVGTIPFWLLLVIFISLLISLQMVMVHLIPYSTDIGIDKKVSAIFLGLLGGCSIPGRLIIGIIADRIGGKNALLICISAQIFCMFWLQVAETPRMIYLFTAIFGFSYGGYVPLIPFLTEKFFGLRSLGVILGIIVFAATTGGVIGPVLAGYIYDVSGSYRPAFIGGGVIIIIGFLATLLMKMPAKKDDYRMTPVLSNCR